MLFSTALDLDFAAAFGVDEEGDFALGEAFAAAFALLLELDAGDLGDLGVRRAGLAFGEDAGMMIEQERAQQDGRRLSLRRHCRSRNLSG